jgi:hypothetical protein
MRFLLLACRSLASRSRPALWTDRPCRRKGRRDRDQHVASAPSAAGRRGEDALLLLGVRRAAAGYSKRDLPSSPASDHKGSAGPCAGCQTEARHTCIYLGNTEDATPAQGRSAARREQTNARSHSSVVSTRERRHATKLSQLYAPLILRVPQVPRLCGAPDRLLRPPCRHKAGGGR